MKLIARMKAATAYSEVPTQLMDIVRLYFTNSLWPSEFYEFELFKFYPDVQRNYIGLRKSKKIWAKNNTHKDSNYIIRDKALTEGMLRSSGFKTTETVLNKYDFQGLDFIESVKKNLPLFGKPTNSYGGKGVLRLTQYNEEYDLFYGESAINGVSSKTLEKLVYSYNGNYVFQKVIKHHPIFNALCGVNALSTIRFLTHQKSNGEIKIIASYMKIPGHNSITDQSIHKDAKVVVIAQDGYFDKVLTNNNDAPAVVEELHSVMFANNQYRLAFSYESSKMVPIPFWEEARKMVTDAAGLFKHTRLLGWDVAITKNGPVIIEVNDKPGLNAPQKFYDKGFLPYVV